MYIEGGNLRCSSNDESIFHALGTCPLLDSLWTVDPVCLPTNSFISAVLRRSNGEVVAAFTKLVSGGADPLVAESLAVYYALTWV